MLHAVPVGPRGADIDHPVIGPGGVVVLGMRTHPRASVRGGEHRVHVGARIGRPYRAAVRNDALRVSAGAREVVHPMLLFVDAASLEPVGPQSVAWCRPGDLVERLAGMPPVLPPSTVAATVARAEQPTTWGQPPSAADEPDPTPEFLALPAPDQVRPRDRRPVRARPPCAAPVESRLLRAAGAVAAVATVALAAQAVLRMWAH